MQDFMPPEAGRPTSARVALSVVIPSHNPEALFFTEIGKLVAERPDWQIVIVDDASDRPIQDFLPAAANLTLLRNPTAKGAGTSRNIGIDAVRGEYTVFLDDDDFMDWGVVERLMQMMEAAPAVDMAVSSYRFLRDGRLAAAHRKDHKTLQKSLQGQDSRIVMLETNERLLRMTNYPWNKLYRSSFIRRIGLRFSETMVQNDVYAHWQSLLGAGRILVTNLVQCTQTVSEAGARISNTRDARRLQAFTALRETYELVQTHQLPRVETAFWAFYQDLVRWMIRSASPETRVKLMQEHVRFAGIAPRNMAALEADTGIKHWSLWDMNHIEDQIPAAGDVTDDPADLDIWLSEISRLKRLSSELRDENDRLRGERHHQHHEIRDRDERIAVLSREHAEARATSDKLRQDSASLAATRRENAELRRQLNSKAARWAFALRGAFRRVVPGRGPAR